MKILHITNNYNNEIIKDNPIIRNIIYELKGSGLKQTVIIPLKQIKPEKKIYTFNYNDLNEIVIPIFGLPFGILIDLRLFLSAKKISNYIKFEFDLIHSHSFISDGYIGYVLSKKFQKPLITSITSTDVYEQLSFFPHLKPLAKKIYNHSAYVVSMSSAIKDKFVKILNIDNPEKINVIPNGLSKDKFENSKFTYLKSDKFKLIFIGKLIKLKNLKRTILAIKQLVKNGYNLEFKIVGDGDLKDNLQKLVKKHKLENTVKFLGKVENEKVYDLIKESNTLIMCSTKETFGMVYLEALSQYRPIIYSEGRGVDGLFENEIGIKCNPFKISSIEKAIEKMIKNYDYYLKQTIQFNKNEYKKFTLENTAKNYFDIYKEVIK